MKVWFAVIGFILGITVGLAGGFALDRSAGPPAAQPEIEGGVPEVCLTAISAARDRLLLNPDVAETLREYRSLGESIANDVSDLRLPNLRETLGEFNNLNERSGELIDRSVNTQFSAAAKECERLAGRTSAEPTRSG